MAGKAERIYNFCHRQPIPCKCLGTCNTNPPIPNTKVEDYLISNNTASGAPFSVCNYGNAFSGSETFAGEGNGRVNTPVNKNMYFRYASMTKFMGMVVLGAALEDGYISSLDDPIANYIDEFNGTGKYIDPTSVISTNGFDSYGSPTYTFNTIDFNLNTITIRHLVNGTAGFGYSFLGTGILRSVLNQLPNPSSNTLCNRNTFIAWLQYLENNPELGKADLIDSFYNNPNNNTFTETFTQSLLNRITNIPFLFKPGTQTIYDICTTVMGSVVGAALQKKGIQKTSTQYFQSRILTPLGITSIWFNCGSSQPPANAESNITDAYFVRNNTYFKSIDPANPSTNPIINTTGTGTNIITNTLYRCLDSSANGDGFTNQAKNTYLQNPTTDDLLAGGYDWSGCGTIPDLCKLLKMLIKKGKNQQNQQVLKSQTVEWILTPKTKEGQGMWLFGDDSVNFMYSSASWCGGFAKFMSNSPTLPFPCGPNTYYWQCYYGMHYYFDTDTGNYMVSGTQTPVCTWYIQESINTYPYGIAHNPAYEPSDNILWKLTTTQ
jgi:CubicO group peptidase (beta-lactamase class C family)